MRTEADKRTEGPQCPSSESGSRYCSQSSGCRRRTCAPVLVFVFVFVLFLLVLVLFLLPVLVLFPGATSHNHPPFRRSFDRRDQDLRTLPLSSQLLLAPGLSVAAAALTAKESILQFLYRGGVCTQHSHPATTISVGNLTSASGKSRFVMHLAGHLFQCQGIPSFIVQVGGGTVTETVTASDPARPPESLTEASIPCTPQDRLEVENEPPDPIAPSRFEVHDRPALRSPSSGSLAVPTKLTLSPALKPAPPSGAVMATVGGALTVMVIASLPERPPLSVTEAVMTWLRRSR